jgi:hypothetical protein
VAFKDIVGGQRGRRRSLRQQRFQSAPGQIVAHDAEPGDAAWLAVSTSECMPRRIGDVHSIVGNFTRLTR